MDRVPAERLMMRGERVMERVVKRAIGFMAP